MAHTQEGAEIGRGRSTIDAPREPLGASVAVEHRELVASTREVADVGRADRCGGVTLRMRAPYAEDMQHARVFERQLTVVNPFLPFEPDPVVA